MPKTGLQPIDLMLNEFILPLCTITISFLILPSSAFDQYRGLREHPAVRVHPVLPGPPAGRQELQRQEQISLLLHAQPREICHHEVRGVVNIK